MVLSTRLLLLLTSTLTVMAAATISPALPAIAAHFGDGTRVEFLTRLVLTLPALFIVLAAPLAGWACDRIGRKPVLLTGLLLYVLAGSSGLLVQSLEGLLVGRAGLGVGVAALMTATTAYMTDIYQGEAQTRVLGLQGAFMAGGGVVFVLFGGLGAELHWRAPFAIYAVALLLWPGLRALPEPPRDSAEDRVALAPGRWLPLYAIGLLGMMFFYFVPVQLPFLLFERMGTGSAVTGVAIALGNVAAAVAGILFWRLRARMSPPAIVGLTALGMALGYAIIGIAAEAWLFALGLVIAGLGLGLLIPNLNQWIVSRADDAVRGRALGGLATAFFLGQFLSPLVSQPVVAVGGFGGLYAGSAIVLGLGAVIAALWAWRSRFSEASLRQRPPP
jgi:MFS family permease